MNLGNCARLKRVCLCSHGSALSARGFALGRCLDTTEILQGTLVGPGTPNADISHKIADNTRRSPNAIKCAPESEKSIEFVLC